MRRCPQGVHGLVQKKFGDAFSALCESMKLGFSFLAPNTVTERSIEAREPVLILLHVGGYDDAEIDARSAIDILIFLQLKGVEIKSYGFGEMPPSFTTDEIEDRLLASAIHGAPSKGLN